jgi:hypothetical protein
MALHVFVIKEAELEDPQDLRARSRKFLNLTNERKNMSTKTLRKRIALVAVAALGSGVLASAPASAAVTAIVNTTFVYASSSVGICSAPAEVTGGTVNTTAENATQLGEIVSGGTINFTIADHDITAANDKLTVSVTGPAAIASHTLDGSANATRSFGAGMQSMTLTAPDTTNIETGSALSVAVTGTGTVQITISRTPASSSSTTVEIYTFTSSTTCVTGTASAANSIVKLGYFTNAVTGVASMTTNTTDADASTGTVAAGNVTYASSAARIANGGQALIGMRIKDGTSSANDVTTQGIFSASATAGAIVGFDAAGLALESSSATVAGPTSGTAQTASVYVKQGTANKNKPVSTVVSVYFNGVLYGTRSITFTGAPTTISYLPAYSSIAKAADTGLAAIAYEITDAAGNSLTSDGAGITGASGTAGNNDPVLAASGTVVDPTQAILSSIGTPKTEASGLAGTVDAVCGTGSGSAKVTLKYTNSSLASIVTPAFDVACAYTAVNYKASLDKASYAPGEIATLTITATDKNGKAVYDVDSAGDGVELGDTGADAVSISLPQLTAVTAPTNTDAFSGGKKSYKFTVGTTEGSFSGVVDLPLYNGTTYAQTAQTVSYKVAAAPTGAVSNADVLKAIVSLIASINKQIAALQKALLMR